MPGAVTEDLAIPFVDEDLVFPGMGMFGGASSRRQLEYPHAEVLGAILPADHHPRADPPGLIVVDHGCRYIGEILYPHLAVEILCPEPMALIAPVDHPLTLLSEVHVADFAASDFIVTQEGCAYRSYIEELLSSSEIKPRSFLKVKNIEAIKQFVMSGLGLAILPRHYVEKEL